MKKCTTKPKAQPFDILRACNDPKVFGAAFRDKATWSAWFAFLAALFGLHMTPDQLAIYQQCTGRKLAPVSPAVEAWLVCGRRAGKSFILAVIACFLAALKDWTPHLGVGERATVMVIAADRRQARTIMRYVKGLLRSVPMLARSIEAERTEGIDLNNRITIEVHTASFRTVRGYTVVAALLDELAFWQGEDSSNPDFEIVSAIRPAMATIPDAMLLCASSPYARKGALWEAYHRYFGQDGPVPVLVWQSDTRRMNPTVPQSLIDAEYEKDPIAAEAEYGAQFRTDLEAYVSREAVEASVEWGVHERGALDGIRYAGFVDVSGGGADSFALAIAHKEVDFGLVDAIREVRPPLSPEAVIAEFADLLKSYGITRVIGDRYGGEFPREQFRKHGIEYEPSKDPKGALYLDFLPMLNSGKIKLLGSKRLVSQLLGLERNTARGGRDSIDHARGGHDDVANAVAGALLLATAKRPQMRMGTVDPDGFVHWRDEEPLNHSRIRWITVDESGREVKR
jgi:hypothetical protein